MLNFIVCEDDLTFLDNMKTIINNFMMSYDVEYEIHTFTGYDKRFERIVKSEIGFKVYFLDIKTKSGSGIDAARFIREEQDDWVSLIIIVTAFSEYRYEALGNRLFLLDFISKVNNCKQKVIEALNVVMKNYDNREKTLNYEYNYIVHKIEFRHIIYIEKEQESKRCIIKTTYNDFIIPKTLSEIDKMLDNRFLKVHRSLIVNLDQIEQYEIKTGEITFKNGTKTHLVARDKKKELINSVITVK